PRVRGLVAAPQVTDRRGAEDVTQTPAEELLRGPAEVRLGTARRGLDGEVVTAHGQQHAVGLHRPWDTDGLVLAGDHALLSVLRCVVGRAHRSGGPFRPASGFRDSTWPPTPPRRSAPPAGGRAD